MSLLRDLVSHWSLEETSGYRADDWGPGELADNNTVLYSASGISGNAADFETSNEEYLSAVVSDIYVAPGDKDLTIVAWVKLESKPTRVAIASTDNLSTSRSWRIDYDGATDRFRFLVFNSTSGVAATVSANNLGSPSIGSWYCIEAYHDATNSLAGIRVNNGTADTSAVTGSMGSAQKQFFLGAYTTATSGTKWDGLIDEVAIWRRLLTTDERTALYASGAGLPWADWNTTLTNIDALYVAKPSDVAAYDATYHTFETTVSITQTGRHAIGMFLRQADTGDSVSLYIDGSLVETRTISDANLANGFGSYFEDGFIYDFTSTGTKTIKVASVADASLIYGLIVREPDSVSGIVEDQGAATHCEPLQCTYGGSTYRLHVEMYTGKNFLTIDEVLQGEVIPGWRYNERYHNGAAIVALSSGVALVSVGHNDNGIKVRYLPGGVYANITSTYTALSTTSLTYCRAAALLDDRVAVLTRGGSNQDPVLALISDIPEIDGTGASATADYVFSGVGMVYPNGMDYHVNGSTEVLSCLFNSRDASGNWGAIHAALFCPQEGTVGEWYSMNGDAASVTAALGTAVTPRFNSTLRDTATTSGGIQVRADTASGQQYALGWLPKITQWPSGATNGKAAALVMWATSSGALNDYDDASAIRFLVQNEGTQTLDASFADLPTDAELDLSPNSYRVAASLMWENDDDTGDALIAVTDRSWGITGAGHEDRAGVCGLYYDWGGHEISVLRVANPLTPASIAFSEISRIQVPTPYRAAFINKAGTNTIAYQAGDNQLHPTHRQTVRRFETLVAASGVTGTGAATTGTTTASGTGVISHTGTGAPQVGNTTASGAGLIGHTGTGALSTGNTTADGTGTVTSAGTVTGTGALTTSAVTASGAGIIAHTGTGTILVSDIVVSGAGALSHNGTGAVTVGNTTSSGVGGVVGTVTGTGSLTAGATTLSGAGSVTGATTLTADDLQAIWDVELETGYTARQMMRIMFAALAGKRSGLGTSTESYYDVATGTTVRISLTPDANGNGTPVVDGS